MRRIVLMTVLAFAMALPGCMAIGARGHTYKSPTIGKELIDLKEARDTGAISEKEYAEHKAKLKRCRCSRHRK